jgi:hypothetical protein
MTTPPRRLSSRSDNGLLCLLRSAAVEALKGDLGDRRRVRDALRASLSAIKPPAGPMEFDQHRQVIRPVYVLRTEKQGGGLLEQEVNERPH